MIKPVGRSPLCPVKMEMQHGQRRIIPLYSRLTPTFSSTEATIPLQDVEKIKTKKIKTLQTWASMLFLTMHYFFLDTLPHLVGGGGETAS